MKAWKAASRKATLGARGKMVGKPHDEKPSPRDERRTWKQRLSRPVPSRDDE